MLQNEDIEREKTNAPRLLSTAERIFAKRYNLQIFFVTSLVELIKFCNSQYIFSLHMLI